MTDEPRYLGVDLAWRDSTPTTPANETGLAVVDARGEVLDVAAFARVAQRLADGPA